MTTNEALLNYFQQNSDGNTEVNEDTPLLSSGLLDSLAIVKLLAFIESEFGVTIDDADFDPDNFESIATIGALVDRMRS